MSVETIIASILDAVPASRRERVIQLLLLARQCWDSHTLAKFLECPRRAISDTHTMIVVAISEAVKKEGGNANDAIRIWAKLRGEA